MENCKPLSFQIDFFYCFKLGDVPDAIALAMFVFSHWQKSTSWPTYKPTPPNSAGKLRLYLLPCNHSLRHHDLHLTRPQEPRSWDLDPNKYDDFFPSWLSEHLLFWRWQNSPCFSFCAKIPLLIIDKMQKKHHQTPISPLRLDPKNPHPSIYRTKIRGP